MTTTPLDAARELFEVLDTNAATTPPGEPMAKASLDAIEAAGLYGPMVPKAVGGLELPLADVVDVYEEISRADGSTGWCYFAADVAAAFFGAYLPDAGADEVFADGVPVVAGQFAPNGTAVVEGDELVLSGDYQFGSGIAHAAWAGAGMLTVEADGGDSSYLMGCLPVEAIELKGNWDVLGLQATASYDYTVREQRLPRHRTFDFFAPVVHRGSAMHALGVLPLTAAGHAGWALGVTRRVLDEVLAKAKDTTRMGAATSLADSERFLFEYAGLEGRYRAGRAWVREVCEEAEAESARGGAVSALTANLVREACRQVNQGGAEIARQAYLLAGTKGLRAGPIERGFRDLHAGAQHFFASPSAAVDLTRSLLDAG
ncbi:MAG: acyl-CoA dehydrogenase family protein [Acidimicrobiales bacterium]|nr:acyl-CoA dehydrogenase family protein [Acidimicrobiales bacterium]